MPANRQSKESVDEDVRPWTWDEMRARYPKGGRPMAERTARRRLKLTPHFKNGRQTLFPRSEVLAWERKRTVRLGQ